MPQVRVNGLRLNYREQGSGAPVLLCLHGISSNSSSWRHQLAGLSANYRVIAPDARGYGQSDDPPAEFEMADFAHDLAGLLNRLGLERVVIIGLSMGGVIAQEFYRHYPQRVLALVLADTNTGGGARPAPERQARLNARLNALTSLTPAQMAEQRAPALLSPQAGPALRQEVIRMVSEIHPAGYRYAAIALDRADTRAVLPRIRVPTLVLWGKYDTVTPRAESEAIVEAAPAARFEVIEGAGHLSNLEQPQAFNRAVRQFLAESLPASAAPASGR